MDMAVGGCKLRRHWSFSVGTQRDLKPTLCLGLGARTVEIANYELKLKVEFHIEIKNPLFLIFFQALLHLVLIHHRLVMPRENAAHAVRALRALPERVTQRQHLRGREPDAAVRHVALHALVVEAHLLVGVSCGEVEEEVVVERVVAGGVVELRERRVGDLQPEGAWLEHGPKDEESEDEEDYDCEEKLPAEAEEAAAAISVAAGTWRLDWRNSGAVIRTVELGLLIPHVVMKIWKYRKVRLCVCVYTR